jgi:DNA polymerase-3 subunit delta
VGLVGCGDRGATSRLIDTHVRHCGVSVLLLTGDDESLLAEELGTRIHEALGGADRSLALDDFDADRPTIDERELVIRSAVDAAATQSLFSEFRVVVLRRIDAALVDSLQPLVNYLANPLDSTRLILTSKGRPPKSIGDAIKKAGGTSVSTSAGDAKERPIWYRTQLEAAGLRLDPAAMAALSEHLGEDVGRFPGILDTLISTFGTSKKLSKDDVLPFVGEAGSVPIYELANAIDGGDIPAALAVLHRMVGAGEMHPLQIIKVLHNHFTRLLRLEGADVTTPREALDLLGMNSKSDFPGKKMLEQLGRLGPDGVHNAIHLIAEADVQLRGTRDWPAELVVEVLVARLARLASRRPVRR